MFVTVTVVVGLGCWKALHMWNKAHQADAGAGGQSIGLHGTLVEPRK